MKELIAFIPTAGKSEEQIEKEADEAIKKFNNKMKENKMNEIEDSDSDRLEKIEKQLDLLTIKVDIILHKIMYAEQSEKQKLNGVEEDDLFEEAKKVVIEAGNASPALLQRKLRIGYARSARLLDILEKTGFIGPADGARPRDVLIDE